MYKTKDGATLGLKLILLKIFLQDIDEMGNARFGVNVNPVFTVSVPRDLKGPRSDRAYTPQQISDAVVEEDVKFDVIKEEWNEYKLPENVILSAKPVLTLVSRTRLYDVTGDPIFRVQHQTIVKGNVPKDMREKYLQMLRPSTTG